MSFSMFIGRVFLPVFGLALAGLLAWQTWPGGNPASRLPFAFASIGGSADVEQVSFATPVQREAIRPTDSPSLILAEGHVAAYPGAEVVVGAELPGTITRVLVQEKSSVRKGDLLIEFRGDTIRASAEEAVARVAQADADLSQIEQEQARANRLPENQVGVAETRERLKARWSASQGPPRRGRCRLSPDRGRIRPHEGPLADRRRGDCAYREPRRDGQPGHPPAPHRRSETTAHRGRGRCLRHPALRARMLRDNHRGGLRGPKLAGHRRGNRRQPDPPPHSPRRPRPTDRHPRSASPHRCSSSPVR